MSILIFVELDWSKSRVILTCEKVSIISPYPFKFCIYQKNSEFLRQPHGRSFLVHDREKFVKIIMPKYFNQTKYTSFQRQLNMYGFRHLTIGMDRNAYYHEYFLKHKGFLCENIRRTSIKGNGVKGKPNPNTEPNFYEMPFVKPDKCTEKGNFGDTSTPPINDEANNHNIINAKPSTKQRPKFSPMNNPSFISCCENPILEWEALEKLDLDAEFSFLS